MNHVGLVANGVRRTLRPNALRTLFRRVAAILAVGLPFALTGASAAPVDGARLFETVSFRSDDIAAFDKWLGVLDRHRADRDRAVVSASLACQGACLDRAAGTTWDALLRPIRSMARGAQLEAVQRAFNAVPYRDDIDNYRVEDYWASPEEFLSRGGDCEDYATAKYLALIDLGWSDEEIRLVAVRETRLKIAHMIVVVYLPGGPVVLDNRLDPVVPAASVTAYQPLFSLTRRSWWIHVAAAPGA